MTALNKITQSLRSIADVLDSKFSQNKCINGQYIVNNINIKYIKLKKLGINPEITEAILIAPENIMLGDNIVLNYHVWINGTGTIEIGDNVSIGPFTIIHSANHNYQDSNQLIRLQGHTYKKVVIENNVWIGANVLILPGAYIETGCVIGAGAIITKRIEKNSVVVGANQIIKKRIN